MHTKKQYSQSYAWPELEAQCTNNTNCEDIDSNSFCVNLKCACNAGYKYDGNSYSPQCIAFHCDKNKDCQQSDKNRMCQNGKCVCKNGDSPNNKLCDAIKNNSNSKQFLSLIVVNICLGIVILR